MIVGLTGGIGSGKTTVANFFAAFNDVALYTADIEAKKLMNSSSTIKKKIIQEFGEHAYKNHQLQRGYLSNIVFKNPHKLAVLNAIVHPEVKKHFQDFVNDNATKTIIIYENAILFESKSNQYCDVIISVFASLQTRIERVIKRDQTTKEEVLQRIQNQLTDEVKLLRSNYVIFNENLENTQNQVKSIHNILTKKTLFI